MKIFLIRLLARPDWPTASKQPTAVVAAPSRAAAVRAFQAVSGKSISAAYARGYGPVTSNPAQVEAALSEPGTVFIATDQHNTAYAPIRPTENQ